MYYLEPLCCNGQAFILRLVLLIYLLIKRLKNLSVCQKQDTTDDRPGRIGPKIVVFDAATGKP